MLSGHAPSDDDPRVGFLVLPALRVEFGQQAACRAGTLCLRDWGVKGRKKRSSSAPSLSEMPAPVCAAVGRSMRSRARPCQCVNVLECVFQCLVSRHNTLLSCSALPSSSTSVPTLTSTSAVPSFSSFWSLTLLCSHERLFLLFHATFQVTLKFYSFTADCKNDFESSTYNNRNIFGLRCCRNLN